MLEVPDFFLTPFERARKKQLLAQKAAREEVERHSKEAALFAKKQIGEEAVQDGHWFFGKRVASGAADSVDGDAVTTKAVEGVDAPYPAGDIIHFRGSLTPYEELTSNFGAFPLQPSAGQKHPLANFGTEQWGNVFGDATRLDVPKLSSSEVQIRHESLDWVIEQLKTSYGAAVEEGACRRLYDMLVSGERFEKLDEPELWVDKYRPLAITDLVGNVDVASYLANWMEKRKVDVDQMQVASSRKGKKKDKKPKRPKKRGRKNDLDDFIVDEDDDDGYWSSDGEMRGIPSTVLLVGPTGSGKTAMIEAVAAQLDYSILEINEGQKRDAKSVLNEIGEATVNHTLVTSGVPAATKTGANGGLANLFAAADKAIEKQIEPSLDVDMSDKDEPPAAKKSRLRKRTVVDSDSEVEAGAVPTNALELDSAAAAPTNAKTDGMEIDAVASSAPLNKRKLLARPAFTPADEESKQASAGQTLIVFDNIDIVFEEDKSFWNAIASMAERSKRPIVLTANSVDVFQQLPTSLGEATIVKETSKPSLDQLAAYANLVCVLEGVWVAKEELEGLVERCEFQIGRVLRVLELASLVSRNAMTSAPSHGQLDLAICKLDSELVDRDKLLQELGGVAMGCVLGATDGLLGMLAEISPKDDRVDVVERPDGGAQQEQSAIFDESQGEALQHQNAVENVEAETGNGVPMERLITDSPTRSATADDESVRVPRKQTTADAVHANILESYSKSCEILSDWDADVRTGLLFCSVLVSATERLWLVHKANLW